MILYKLGLFGIDWDHTPFMDNKASFQRGINQAMRRTATELADNLGRVRSTSKSTPTCRTRAATSNSTRKPGISASGRSAPRRRRQAIIARASRKLRSFNARLPTARRCSTPAPTTCKSSRSHRQRHRLDLGNPQGPRREHNNGWFDFRADDRYWFAYGQLYAYYGLMKGPQADFKDVIKGSTRQPVGHDGSAIPSALRIQPFIIANGREDGWIMPTHLTTMGFYVLQGTLQPGRDQQRAEQYAEVCRDTAMANLRRHLCRIPCIVRLF